MGKTSKPSEPQPESTPSTDKAKTPRRVYSDEEIYQAVSAVQFNGSNINRTALALEIPYATLHGWVQDFEAGLLSVSIQRGVKEKRGDLAAKLESLVHSAVEVASSPAKLAKATFLQLMTGSAIGIDKIRILRGQGLDSDPAVELCRLLGLNRSQLPERLELLPGDEIPVQYFKLLQGAQPIIDISPLSPESNLEPQPAAESGSSDDDGALLDAIPDDEDSN